MGCTTLARQFAVGAKPYLDEMTWRCDNRKNPFLFRDTISNVRGLLRLLPKASWRNILLLDNCHKASAGDSELFLLALCGGCWSGCAVISHNYVMTTTSTIIALQIAENPSTQLYEAKMGYCRSEFALIPTNGPPVLMELRYSGILSKTGGIYQRLAVGEAAVRQPGAAFLFAKDASGTLSTNVIEAVTTKIMNIPER